MRSTVLPGVLLLGAAAVALAARWMERPAAYPVVGVLIVLGSMATEILLCVGCLQPGSYHRSWGRALVAVLVSLGFLAFYITMGYYAFFSSGSMPIYVAIFHYWMLAVSIGLGLLFLWSALASLPAEDTEGA
jgi:hypothetical protein